LAAELRAFVGRLGEIRAHGPVEEQKTFLREFIDRIEVNPKAGDAVVYWKKIPAPSASGANGAGMSFTVVAGARYKPEKALPGPQERLPLPCRRAA